MRRRNVDIMHMTKAELPTGATVAMCGRSIHSHLVCRDAVLVNCQNCLKQLYKKMEKENG